MGAIVICPGGAYRLRVAHEGKNYAEFLTEHGYTSFVLDYRVAPHKFPLPLLDARRAIRFVRFYADKYGIDKNKIAIMGSSAGRHLAAMTATYYEPIEFENIDEIDKEDFIPNAQILCYPVIKLLGKGKAHKKTGVFNKDFIMFLVYTFFLFMGSSFLSTFFSVYFTSEGGLGGTIGLFSLLVTVATFIEWAIMMVFGKTAANTKPRYIFMLVGIAGVIRSGVIYFLGGYTHTWISFLFMGVWFGLLWAAATPYIKKIVPEENLATAQGIWTITASGAAPFVVSLLGGNLVEIIGLKNLFGVNAIMLALLVVFTPLLVRNTSADID